MSSWGAGAGSKRPFVGSRPFEFSEHMFFFGREGELNALELQVEQNRFVAVVGRPGCGKSSLVRAGLRARLENVSRRPWSWVEIRPGGSPIQQLALGLAGLTRNTGDLLDAWADRFELILSKSSFGIGEALAHIPALGDDGRRVLLFVDQFEELFRFADFWSKSKLDVVSAAERRDEATMFVRALLTAMKSPLLPIHIIVSIRSECLGRCAGFHGLPEAISWSPFLVPGMTRDQREDVIRKPVQLAGGQIDARLVQRALNDTNDDPDQLPNLQQTMMRCWERAYHRETGQLGHRPHLTIEDYANVGGVSAHRAA